MMASTLQVLDTEYNADSAEWCPHQNNHDVLLCGTYQLDQSSEQQTDSSKPQIRLGRLHVYRLGEETLHLQQSRDMSGILDIKWCPSTLNSQSYFGLVNSTGQLQVHRLTDDKTTEDTTQIDLGDQVLGLSLDWSNKVHQSSDPDIACSTSDGHISICKFHQGQLKCTFNWKAHDFEAWITAFNSWNTNIIYSGGDDTRLKGWDTRQDPQSPVFVCKRHTMGVCSLQCHPTKEHILTSGSYDENVIVWDCRNMKSPLAETNIGGGVWRIKWDPHDADYILTASMYNGFHLIDANNYTDGKLSVIFHYNKHESIGYGADFNHGIPTNSNTRTIATCSFYDHILHLWSYRLE